MPSTNRPTLADLFPALARRTTNVKNAVSHVPQSTRWEAISATSSKVAFTANGDCYITKIVVVYDATAALDAANFYTWTAASKTAAGGAGNAIGAGVSNAAAAFTNFVQYNIYNAGNNPGTLLADGQSVVVTATKSGTASNVSALVVVFYAPIVP
jgi:hypothetical protein